ncbi:interleukin-31 receptor subunit alpha [Myripristis murdjan]|uniref:interleukin-31 receptor subunit alpha n=1 Tax=Myripristis murdjan TaxID=586833 RepID=UPI001175C877|nr:interleukin-31 receptor subunit alpha-like [Myripristis murdjan]
MFLRRNSSPLVTLGLISVFCTSLPSLVKASSVVEVNCRSMNTSSMHAHCGVYPDGVHDLDCFGKHKTYGSVKQWQCKWAPGSHTSNKTYTLIIQQPSKNRCVMYDNISRTSHSKFTVSEKKNMTAYVVEKSDLRNCTKAFFTALPNNTVRCGPPVYVSFSRHSRKLEVTVSWPQVDQRFINKYNLMYKASDSLSRDNVVVQSRDKARCTVDGLNSSLAYQVQIQCDNNSCPQCPWSDSYTVQPELTAQPVVLNVEDTDVAQRKGCRLVVITWKFPEEEQAEGYNVTVEKASGEVPDEWMTTTRPQISLVLSYSGYHVSIRAFNRASTSPALTQTVPPREDMADTGAGKLNVSLINATSLTVFWKDDLIQHYCCFSVEWSRTNHKAAYMSFFENANNYKSISLKNGPLEPYQRYSISLHTRTNKETCNMMHTNGSESTYGSAQFYFIEGSPVSAPANISACNVTLNSMVLQWLPIPEEDLRGFLMGYIIHYTEYHHRETEKNVTVSPDSNSHELVDLKSGTAFLVEISAFTRAGVGVRSTASLFKTNSQGDHTLVGIIIGFTVVTALLILICPLLKRAKVVIWPSIPNPRNSNAMQKIEVPFELELLELTTQKSEEWDTESLHIVERAPESTRADSAPPIMPYVFRDTEADENSESELLQPDEPFDWTETDINSVAGLLPGVTVATFVEPIRQDFPCAPLPFPSGYTTMEMFQQGMSHSISEDTTAAAPAAALQPEDTDVTVKTPGLDYTRQFSSESNNGSVFLVK